MNYHMCYNGNIECYLIPNTALIIWHVSAEKRKALLENWFIFFVKTMLVYTTSRVTCKSYKPWTFRGHPRGVWALTVKTLLAPWYLIFGTYCISCIFLILLRIKYSFLISISSYSFHGYGGWKNILPQKII